MRTHRSPDNHTTRDLLLRTVGKLQDNALLLDLLHHRLRQNINLGLLERRLGVVDELLGEHREHRGESLDERDLDVRRKFGVPRAQILFKEIMDFAAQLDTGGTATDDDHVQESVNLLFALTRERSGLEACDITLASS